jgi:hypothetical protein
MAVNLRETSNIDTEAKNQDCVDSFGCGNNWKNALIIAMAQQLIGFALKLW